MGRADPKCWLCGTLTSPLENYQPLICSACLPEYKERKFVFVRASQREIDELFPMKDVKNLRVVVYHTGYGCDTGCCGHYVELQDGMGKELKGEFQFDHPDGEYVGASYQLTPKSVREFVVRLVTDAFGEEHVKDIDWDQCIIDEW